ncbi:MAG: hypothetical protein GF365_01485 [Candidatus Buchananbacteria bacterium]|nr:hypothetical protein [Candidatus Buchananbacteria bacterium]
MSRQEEDKSTKVEELEAEISRMKKGLKRKQNKKMFGCSGCLILFLIIILAISLIGAYVLAKSGLKEVPFLTANFYHEPEPARLVEADNVSEADKDILARLEKSVSQELVAQQQINELTVSLDLSEEVLSAVLRDKIKEKASLAEKIEYAQIAILPDNLEVFIENKDPSNLIITLNIKPTIKDGKADLEIVNFKIGDLTLPNFIGNISFGFIAEKSLNNFLNVTAKYGQIQNINLMNGNLILEILINNFKELL